ncbi:MAG: AbrB family transcriptional regulator [Pseudomonadota bacterium]
MTRAELSRTALTLGIGGLGAAFFGLIGFPAAPLTGPAAAVSLASVAGLRVLIPPRLRDACFLVLGLSIGSTVTPEVVATARAWPLSLLALSVTLVLTLVVVRAILQSGFGFDRVTALLASTPGHLSFVLAISSELRADIPKVAMVQSVRVLLLTLLVPLIIAVTGAEGTPGLGTAGPAAPLALAVLFALALGAGLGLGRLRVPAPLLIGGILVSAIGHGTDLTPGTVPGWMTVSAFVVMGALIGARFNGLSRAEVFSGLGAGVAATLAACALAAVGAGLASLIVDVSPGALLLAFAPGGVEVMAALAVETGLEPAFVAAHHVSRLMFLTVIFPVLLAMVRGRA